MLMREMRAMKAVHRARLLLLVTICMVQYCIGVVTQPLAVPLVGDRFISKFKQHDKERVLICVLPCADRNTDEVCEALQLLQVECVVPL